MSVDVDIAVAGSGFGGTLLAMIARRLGFSVIVLERGRHPRFAIGESASPLAGVLLEQLADRYDLPRIRPFASYGEWRRCYPHVTCGLKRGFTYFKQNAGCVYRAAPDRSNQLMVAASPSDEVGDTHWLRADVDHFFLQEAIALGADYLDEVQLDRFERHGSTSVVDGHRRTQPVRVRARVVVDATGPRGFLARALPIAENAFDGYPAVQALYSHFTDVDRCDQLPDYAADGVPPYPVDDAALHHVLDEGWIWVLRFGNGVTSAGVAAGSRFAQELRFGDGEPAWRRLLARYPAIAAQFGGAAAVREFTWMPKVPYRASAAAGDGWVLLPSAAAFVDPLFSTGIPMTLLGIERIAAAWASDGLPAHEAMAWYASNVLAEADHTARFVAGCYAAFPRFADFAAYSMFYFAAASFSEMARRLGRAPLAPGFLACADPPFAAALRRIGAALRDAAISGPPLADEVTRAIEPLNIAGLSDASKRNWYGVDVEDVVRGSGKLGMPAEEVRRVAPFRGISD